MITVLSDIPAVRDAESQGKRLYNKIFVLLEEDVDYSQLPTITESESARTMGELTQKSGATGWVEFNFVKYTAAAGAEGSAGDITSTNNNTLSGTLGGDSIAIDNFLQNIGVPCFVGVIDRFTQKKTIYGRPYSPMYYSAHSKRKNAENTSCDVTFSQESFFQPLEYLGSFTPEPEDDDETA